MGRVTLLSVPSAPSEGEEKEKNKKPTCPNYHACLIDGLKAEVTQN